jgi:hypothetical protein
MTKIIACSELRYRTLDELDRGSVPDASDRAAAPPRPVRPRAPLCSPASKAAASPLAARLTRQPKPRSTR